MVEQIFDQALKGGQLDECPITIKELSIARESFIATLKGVFHPRIRYPEPEPSAEVGGEDVQDDQVSD